MFKGDDILSSLKFLSAWQVENLDSSIRAFISIPICWAFFLGLHMRKFFNSIKTIENSVTGINGMEISWEVFQKIENFRKAKHWMENSGKKVKRNGNSRLKKSSGNFGIPHKVVLFENYEIYCSILHWKFPEIETGIFYRMKSARGYTLSVNSRECCLIRCWKFLVERETPISIHSSCLCVYPQHLRWCVIKLHKTCQRYFIISYRCFFFATRYLTNSMKYWCWYAVYLPSVAQKLFVNQ